MELEKEINAILTKWNPIGVPEFIASDEYTDCIPILMRYSSSLEAMEAGVYYLQDEYLGMPIARTEENRKYMESISKELFDVFSKYSDDEIMRTYKRSCKKEL